MIKVLKPIFSYTTRLCRYTLETWNDNYKYISYVSRKEPTIRQGQCFTNYKTVPIDSFEKRNDKLSNDFIFHEHHYRQQMQKNPWYIESL